MKRILYTLVALGAMLSMHSCHKPEFVAPTADSQGLRSLEAIFTFGPYIDQTMGVLNIGKEPQNKYVIPVPYFFPETSDDETTPYMTRVRVRAILEPNCKIDPPLTILDLTKDNIFTYTDPYGESREICITGERVKSNACELQAFTLDNPQISGIIDSENKKVSIVSVESLEACTAKVQLSAHATITPDPAEPHNYNEPVKFTVIAHDGVTKAEYTVVKEVPAKINKGFNESSLKPLFSFEPVSRLGFPTYKESVSPTMAMIDGKLVVAFNNGNAPAYLNAITGAKEGEIVLGDAVAGSVANDDAAHMLIVNRAAAKETVNIYKTSSVTTAPELFHSFANDNDLPISKMKVIGNIDQDAVIILTNSGIAGVTTSSSFWKITVTGGQVASTELISVAGTGAAWGEAPVNAATVIPCDAAGKEGYMLAYYADWNKLTYVKNDLSVGANMGTSNGNSWGWNVNCLASSHFNNVNYAALLVASHFPHWGIGPQLYMYDITDKSNLTEEFTNSPALVLANGSLDWYQKADAGVAAGDVIISQSADGFMLYVYYYDHNAGVIGGYSADCIQR